MNQQPLWVVIMHKRLTECKTVHRARMKALRSLTWRAYLQTFETNLTT